jgi:hypothetical protein
MLKPLSVLLGAFALAAAWPARADIQLSSMLDTMAPRVEVREPGTPTSDDSKRAAAPSVLVAAGALHAPLATPSERGSHQKCSARSVAARK